MTPWVLTRESLGSVSLAGSVCTVPVRDASGRVVVDKGTSLCDSDRSTLAVGVWDQLHLIRCDAGDLIEGDAGIRLARAAAGAGVEVGAVSRGQWPLRARWRGVLEVDSSTLGTLNTNADLSVYTLFDGQVVDSGEVVGSAKVIPFVVSVGDMEAAERLVSTVGAPVRVRGFTPHRVSAVVMEGLASGARVRFAETIAEKVHWFGGVLDQVDHVPPDVPSVRDAIDRAARTAHLMVVAGTRAMDPLDPAFVALEDLGARLVRRGMPAHPGSLCWIARLGEGWVLGLPSCGVLSQATIFDLVFTWLFADMAITPERLASVGHGGLLTRDMAYRFPPYRAQRERGEVE